MADGDAFELAGDDRGVLCVHGFTGTPFDVSYLGERLHERGLTVVAPRLPGHHTDWRDLDSTSWRDWYAAAETALDELAARCRTVSVVGQSMGALLVLRLAAMHPERVQSVVALAAPLWLPPLAATVAWATRRLPWLTRLFPTLPKRGGVDVKDPDIQARSPSYRVVPVRALHQYCELIEVVTPQLASVRAPLLVIHSRHDHTAPFAGSRALVRRVRSSIVRHRELRDSYHLVPHDVERDEVAREVGEFLEEHMPRRQQCAM